MKNSRFYPHARTFSLFLSLARSLLAGLLSQWGDKVEKNYQYDSKKWRLQGRWEEAGLMAMCRVKVGWAGSALHIDLSSAFLGKWLRTANLTRTRVPDHTTVSRTSYTTQVKHCMFAVPAFEHAQQLVEFFRPGPTYSIPWPPLRKRCASAYSTSWKHDAIPKNRRYFPYYIWWPTAGR